MKNYCIWIVSPPGYIHSHCFDEVALGLHYTFQKIGYDVPIIRNLAEITDCPIVLGGNLIPFLGKVRIPKTTIFYNLEQIQVGSPGFTEGYINLLRSHQVWDYSKKNISELERFGITNAKFCGLGYVPEMTRINPIENDVDILFYGSLNERRLHILRQLSDKGLKVEALYGVYGKMRDCYIAKSKIVLNIHFYETKIFEAVRIYDLLANKRFVISELGSDHEMENPFYGSLVFASYENLVSECIKYLKEDDLRNEIANKGFSWIKSTSQVQFLKKALAPN